MQARNKKLNVMSITHVLLHIEKQLYDHIQSMRQHWIGPYKILSKLSDVTYRVKKEPIGKPKVIHHNRLKPYCERMEPKDVRRKKCSAEKDARKTHPTFLHERRAPKRYGFD